MGELTKAQRTRLDKLATYLEGLPEDYGHFDMALYITSPLSREAEAKYARENGGVQHCGTAACAAGHGPAAGVLVPPRMITYSGFVNWDDYAELFYGQTQSYGWLFHPSWDSCDNHHWGAAARIRRRRMAATPPPMPNLHPLFAEIVEAHGVRA